METWNPYRSSHILDQVLKLCPVPVLRSARLVSKEWRIRSTKFWRQKVALRIGQDNTNELMEMHSHPNGPSLLSCFPFRNYAIDAQVTSTDSAIFKQILPTAKYLFLANASLEQVVRAVLQNGVCLDYLVLHGPTFGAFPYGDLHVNLGVRRLEIVAGNCWENNRWMPLFRCIPNLKSVCVSLPTRHIEFGATDLLASIKSIRREQSPAPVLDIIKFQIEGEGISRYTSSVSDAKLQLCHLSLDGSLEKSLPDSLLATQADNVFEIEDYRHNFLWISGIYPASGADQEEEDYDFSTMNGIKLAFPKLLRYTSYAGIYSAMYALLEFQADKLASIIIQMDFCPVQLNLDDNRTISGRLENQREFYLTSRDKFSTILKALYFPSVCYFEYTNTRNILTEANIELLAICMPNLSQLKMASAKSSIPGVFKSWPNLQALTVTCASTTCNVWDDDTFVGGEIPGIIFVGSADAERRTIRNLKKLQRFVFDAKDVCFAEGTTLSDLSATHGFLKLPNLTTLHFPFTKITEDCRAQLKKHVRVLQTEF